MKFIIHEIKLWFKNENDAPKSYFFEANKINVITGSSSRGKTTIGRIIDYCLLSGKVQIPDRIINAVSWFGIRFNLDDQEISIARASPDVNVVSKQLFFDHGSLPENPKCNSNVKDIKNYLNKKFNITDEFSKGFFNNFSFRHFLIFCFLTEEIISQSNIYFDGNFFRDEYKYSTSNKLKQIFELIIGANSLDDQLKNKSGNLNKRNIENKIDQIKSNLSINNDLIENFKNQVAYLVEVCKKYDFLKASENFDNEKEAIAKIEKIVNTAKSQTDNNHNFDKDGENLKQKQKKIIKEITKLSRYQHEYNTYKANLNKSADSLQPIEFLKKNLLNQLVNSYETQVFLESLAESFSNIKETINQNISPFDFTEELKNFNQQLEDINILIDERNNLTSIFLHDKNSLISIGNIEAGLKQLSRTEDIEILEKDISLNEKVLSQLITEKNKLFEESANRFSQAETSKLEKIELLNKYIQEIFESFNLVSGYNGYNVSLDIGNLDLKITPPQNQTLPLFPIAEIGSKANYVFLHLSMYLGLHLHIVKENIQFIPKFMFIDQPSIPFYEGDGDEEMLLTIFKVLNIFIDKMVNKYKTSFQIILIEHAQPSYWEDLSNFILIDDFIDEKALIPSKLIENV